MSASNNDNGDAPVANNHELNAPLGQENAAVDTVPIRLQPGMRNVVLNAPNGTTVRLQFAAPNNNSNSHQQGDTGNGFSAGQASNNISSQRTTFTFGQASDPPPQVATARPRQPRQIQRQQIHRIPLPGRGQQIRIVTGGRSGTRVVPWHTTGTIGQQGAVNVSQLQPQPLPHAQQQQRSPTTSDDPHTNENDHDRFKCPICYEFLREPVSCGSCNTHFCLPCIRKVLTGSASNQKCPTCRADMPLEQLRPDVELQEEIRRAAAVPCQYPGCDARLALSDVAQHEEICPMVMMRCRYSTFGCDWRGLRRDLASHESECPLMRISVLVEQFRLSKAQQEQSMAVMQQRFAALQSMSELQGGMLRQLHRRPMHLFDLLDLTYTVLCNPAMFLYTKDIWRVLHQTKESRALAANFCSLLPIVLVVAKNAARGFRALLLFGDVWSSANEDELLDVIDLLLLSSLSTVLGILLMACFFLDPNRSPINWTTYTRWKISTPIFRDLAQLSCFLLVVVAFEMDGNSLKAHITTEILMIATFWFPRQLNRILEEANGISTPSNCLCSSGRAENDVLVSSLENGLVAAVAGPWACIDHTIVMRLLMRYSTRGDPGNDVLTNIDSPYLWSYLGVRLSYLAFLLCEKEADMTLKHELYLKELAMSYGLGFLLGWVSRALEVTCRRIGNKLGKIIVADAKSQIVPQQQGGIHRSYSLLGITSYVVWISMLFAIGILSY